MTSYRSLAASFVLVVLAGCAVLPGFTADSGCLNCATADAAGDAKFTFDGGPAADAGLVPSARSALCVGSCAPDAGAYSALATPDYADACANKDGGTYAYDGGGSVNADLACRVVPTTSNPVVECTTAGSHGDGASCNTGADCAPGYECVGTPGACHHYCCDETACTRLGIYLNEPGRFFCDVQPETASPSTNVPVCMLAQPCDLLQGMCGDGMTCTLVDPLNSDTTSCVAVGTAKEGDSCEVDHCGANMVCFGPIGSRTCHQLCDLSHTCTTFGQSCNTQWPTLQKLQVGICQ